MIKPALEITLDFANRLDESTQVVITGTEEEAWIRIRKEDDDDYKERSVMLDPQEIDVVISALTLFKHRVFNPKKVGEEN